MAKFIITLLIVFGCTFGVFELLFANHSELFFTNLAVTFVAECIFLLNVPLFTDEQVVNVKNAVGAFYLNLCAVSLIVWMLVYNLTMRHDFTLPIFIVGILVIIGAFVLIGSITTSTASAALAKQDKLDSVINQKKNYKSEISSYAFNTRKALSMNDFPEKEDLLKAYQIAVDKAMSIPAYALENNTTETDHLILLLSEIQEICYTGEWNKSTTLSLSNAIRELTYNIKKIH